MANPKLLTTQEFNKSVREWADTVIYNIRRDRRKNESSGNLMMSLERKEYIQKRDKTIHGIAFRFERYGVFLHYGVGRGYIRENGVLKRGARLDQNKWMVSKMRQKGYRESEIKKMKITYDKMGLNRSPENWIDWFIRSHMKDLAEISGEYFADNAFKKVLGLIGNSTIDKNE